MSVRIITGDCRDVLRTMPDESVHCVVTSPPYFGLRDYGVDGQIGLEQTPDAFVAEMVGVFREVRRVLRDDGTLWLNLGDSYAGSGKGGNPEAGKQATNKGSQSIGTLYGTGKTAREAAVTNVTRKTFDHIKAKDLIGIPWRVAFALQQPFYTGPVQSEMDRMWLAAMLDAEGCISISEYETGDRLKSNVYIGITNSSVPIIEKCGRLFPQEKQNVYQKGGIVNRTVFRWDVERMEQKSLFLREVYPYLVAKRKQAILGYTFVEMQRGLVSKKKGYLAGQQEQRSWLAQSISILNKGGDVDLPDWVVEPPSLHEPGFYLRQDIIWHKPNPMPESVQDRCTKAHEYLFLLSKSPRYHFDADAVKEQAIHEGRVVKATGAAAQNAQKGEFGRTAAGFTQHDTIVTDRNKRSVWTVATQPFSEAHFATFPPALIEPCIKAGCPKDGTVLDPFGGAGTTGLVASRLGRNAVLIELNPEYVQIAKRRLEDDAGMFAEVAA